jgi:ubiquinone/menaquinone biosynthesis C-methylase UbiE
MGIEQQGAKPNGRMGIFFGKMMNKFHTPLYSTYFHQFTPKKQSSILDLGCGGGKFIQFLAELDKSYKLYGLDHSQEMIELSKRVNAATIQGGQTKIILGSVLEIPVESSTIDLATAFETIIFWPSIEKAFSEIYRILKNDGEFIIINRFPKEGTKWWKMAKLKTESDYRHELENSGFKRITTDFKYKKGWIIVRASKM